MDIRKLNSEMMILVNVSYSELNEEHKKVIEELLPVIKISVQEVSSEYPKKELPEIFADFFSHIQSFRWNENRVMSAVDRFLDVLKFQYRQWYEFEYGEEDFARKHELSDFPYVKLPSLNNEPAEVINLEERRASQKK